MTYKKINRKAEVAISGFSKKGNGTGKYIIQDGSSREAEVPFTMPGDVVRVELTSRKAGVSSGRLEEILKPAERRIAPVCKHFGICGGCRWQHIPHSDQLEIKQNLVKKYFNSILEGVALRPIVSCDPPWEYRNKMEFSFSSDAAQNKYLGLVMDSSRGKVFNLTECHLVTSWFAKTVETVRQWWVSTGLEAYHPYKNTGALRTLIVREGQRTGDRLVMLTVSGNPDFAVKKHQLESLVTVLREAISPENPSATLTIFLRIQQIAKGMATNFYEMLLFGPDHLRERLTIQAQKNQPHRTIEFTVSPSAFFQPNTRQAEKLYTLALQMVDINPDSIVYDLYCGTGTLGICASSYAKQVIGIELSPESSLDARTNAKNNQIQNVTILTGSVNDVINERRHKDPLTPPDIIMVDPPRVGLDPEVIRQLLEMSAPKLLYISCNPATQAQNIAELVQGGYRLKAIQPVDQFPQTVHVENIAILEK